MNLWYKFAYDELTVNVRQKNDLTYSELLARVRISNMTSDDRLMLESRLVPGPVNAEQAASCYQELLSRGEHPVCLMSTIEACRKVNETMQLKVGSPVINIASIDDITHTIKLKSDIKSANQKLLSLSSDISRIAGLETNLKLNIGSRVMLRRNIDMDLGLVNGSMSVLADFIYDNTGQVNKLAIHFDNGQQYNLSRSNTSFQLMRGIYVQRHQFAVSLSYAITIHKAQGLSLECAIIDLGKSTFGSGMAYVALLRVRTLSKLFLLDLSTNRFESDRRAIIEYNRLRKEI